jgi:hypothetical protein
LISAPYRGIRMECKGHEEVLVFALVCHNRHQKTTFPSHEVNEHGDAVTAFEFLAHRVRMR